MVVPSKENPYKDIKCKVSIVQLGGEGGGLGGKVSETRKIKERGRVSKTAAPLSSSSFLYFLNLVR